MKNMQLIVFRLGGELYGAEIYNVQEIILPVLPTKVPNNPDFIEGVIDYRGEIVPVLDLKKRFSLDEGQDEYGKQSRFIVVDVEERKAIFIVDEVAEILRVQDGQQIGEPPEMTKIGKEYLTGVVRMDERLIILLDLSKILTVEEKDILKNV